MDAHATCKSVCLFFRFWSIFIPPRLITMKEIKWVEKGKKMENIETKKRNIMKFWLNYFEIEEKLKRNNIS